MKTDTIRTHELPEMLCPYCGRAHELHTGLGEKAPQAGDVGVCWGCHEPSIFTQDGLSLRKPTDEESAALATDVDLRQARHAAATSATPSAAARRMRPQ